MKKKIPAEIERFPKNPEKKLHKKAILRQKFKQKNTKNGQKMHISLFVPPLPRPSPTTQTHLDLHLVVVHRLGHSMGVPAHKVWGLLLARHEARRHVGRGHQQLGPARQAGREREPGAEEEEAVGGADLLSDGRRWTGGGRPKPSGTGAGHGVYAIKLQRRNVNPIRGQTRKQHAAGRT